MNSKDMKSSHPMTDEELDTQFRKLQDEQKPYLLMGDHLNEISDIVTNITKFEYQNSVNSWNVFIDIFKFWLTLSTGFLGWLFVKRENTEITLIITAALFLVLIVLLMTRWLIMKKFLKKNEGLLLKKAETLFGKIKYIQNEINWTKPRKNQDNINTKK